MVTFYLEEGESILECELILKITKVAYIINVYASYFLYSLLVISSLSLEMLCFEFRKSAFY